MKASLRPRKGIRRFADDALSKELQLMIKEMAKNITSEISSKIPKKCQSEISFLTGLKSNIN